MQGQGRFRPNERKGRTLRRETLSVRDPNIERLLASMPFELGEDAPDVRRFATNLLGDASRFERDKAKHNAMAKGHRQPTKFLGVAK